jgi:hypothetical protein
MCGENLSKLAQFVPRYSTAWRRRSTGVLYMQHAALGDSRLSVGASQVSHCLLGIVNNRYKYGREAIISSGLA